LFILETVFVDFLGILDFGCCVSDASARSAFAAKAVPSHFSPWHAHSGMIWGFDYRIWMGFISALGRAGPDDSLHLP
jgi:hypothetical protein